MSSTIHTSVMLMWASTPTPGQHTLSRSATLRLLSYTVTPSWQQSTGRWVNLSRETCREWICRLVQYILCCGPPRDAVISSWRSNPTEQASSAEKATAKISAVLDVCSGTTWLVLFLTSDKRSREVIFGVWQRSISRVLKNLSLKERATDGDTRIQGDR